MRTDFNSLTGMNLDDLLLIELERVELVYDKVDGMKRIWGTTRNVPWNRVRFRTIVDQQTHKEATAAVESPARGDMNDDGPPEMSESRLRKLWMACFMMEL